MSEHIYHVGVLGMKWGRRKGSSEEKSNSRLTKSKLENAQKIVKNVSKKSLKSDTKWSRLTDEQKQSIKEAVVTVLAIYAGIGILRYNGLINF